MLTLREALKQDCRVEAQTGATSVFEAPIFDESPVLVLTLRSSAFEA